MSILKSKVAAVAVMALVIGVFGGCDLLGKLPPGDHIGDNGLSIVEPSATLGQFDVTLHNAESKFVVNTGTNCGWNAACMSAAAAKVTNQAGFIQAMSDCELWVGGQVCGIWIYKAAEVFVWGPAGPDNSCMGIRIDALGNYVGGNGLLGLPGTWYTTWPGNSVGYNSDGAGYCTR